MSLASSPSLLLSLSHVYCLSPFIVAIFFCAPVFCLFLSFRTTAQVQSFLCLCLRRHCITYAGKNLVIFSKESSLILKSRCFSGHCSLDKATRLVLSWCAVDGFTERNNSSSNGHHLLICLFYSPFNNHFTIADHMWNCSSDLCSMHSDLLHRR